MNKQNIRLFDEYGILFIDNTSFLFDIDDLHIIQSKNWYRDKDGYLVYSYYYLGKRYFVRFHRLVMNAKSEQIVDHINRNRADNRKKNLRICNHGENNRNRGVYTTNTSGTTGVHYDKKRKKWVASITYNCKRVFIGRYEFKEEAIRARNIKEIELFKNYAPQGVFLEAFNEV